MNATAPVTQLIVDASGAKGGVDDFVAAMARAKAAAVEGGNATATSFERAQQRWVQSLAATDPVIKAQIATERELARQRRVNADAMRLGIITEAAAEAQLDRIRQQGAVTIDMVSRKYLDQKAALERLTAAQDQYTASQRAMVNSAANVNQRLGVRQDFGAEARGADIAAYGNELDRLRAKFSPLFALQQRYRQELGDINQAVKVGAISERERTDAVTRAKDSFAAHVVALRSTAAANENLRNSGALARHEVINLSRQFQDVGVSLASGQSPFLVMIQQGTQIADVFAASKGTVGGFLRQTWDWMRGILTPARLATGAILGVGAAAVTAASQWGDAQRQISLQLRGVGQASGASLSDINAVAAQGASPFGLSVAEARQLAAALAATGRIGREELAPIVALGHDVARVFGVDAAEAAQLLAKSFSDPVKGAATLNERLGFMDAALERNVKNLAEQNRAYEARRLLIDAVAKSLDGVAASKGASAQFWTAVGNAMSNAWDAFGQFAARTTGIGWMPGLEEKIAAVRDRIVELEAIEARRNAAANRALGTTAALERERNELQKLTAEYERNARATFEARQRQDSTRYASAVRSVSPEIDARQQIENTLTMLRRVENDAAFDEGNVLLRSLGLTRNQLSLAVARTQAALDAFKSQTERAIASAELSFDALSARTPQQRAEVARRGTLLNASGSAEERARQADLAYQTSLRGELKQIADAERSRLLTGQQRLETSRLELQIAGRSTAEQELQRANLQARHQLEQDALRIYGDREAYDRRHLAALEKQNEFEARNKQLLAEQNLARDIAFERSQLFRSPEDQQIASRLRGVYGDRYESEMNGALAAQMRINDQLKTGSELLTDFGSGLASEYRRLRRDGVDAAQAFGAAWSSQLTRIQDKLSDLPLNRGLQMLVGGAFGGVGSGGGILGGIFGGGTGYLHSPGGYSGAFPQPIGVPVAHDGYFPGRTGLPTRDMHPGYFETARRFHSGKLPWNPATEMPAIIDRREEINYPAVLARKYGGGQQQVIYTVTVVNNAGAKVTERRATNNTGGVDLVVMIDEAAASSVASGQSNLNRALESRYGLDPTRGMVG